MPPFRSKRAPYYDKSGFSCGTASAFYALFTELPRTGFLGNWASASTHSRKSASSILHIRLLESARMAADGHRRVRVRCAMVKSEQRGGRNVELDRDRIADIA